MRKSVHIFISLMTFCTLLYFIILRWTPGTVRFWGIYHRDPGNFSSFDDMEESVDQWLCFKQSVCIYSAYWDARYNPPYVRLVAIISRSAKINSWYCLLKYNNNSQTEVPLKVETIQEGHGKRYTAVFLLCNAKNRPEEVQVSAGNFNSSFIMVKRTDLSGGGKGRLAVCVRPFFGSFNNNCSLIAEFIAYYRELGADHFSFYDYKSDVSLKELLNELMEDGFPIDLLPWNLPKKFSDAWGYGQMAFSADCMYRNSHEYEYVVIVDVDEFIVPKKDISLKEVIQKVDRAGKFGTYVFRQTFFCMEYEDDPISVNLSVPLITQSKTRHEKKMWPYNDRSKCIVRPVAVVVPGIHFTWVHFKSWKSYLVSNNIALLHHYRAEKCVITKGDTGVIERRMLRYGERILNSPVVNVWRKTISRR